MARLKSALCIIFLFMIIEVVGGLISGSLALLADAAHMFTDALALLLAVLAQGVARRPATAALNFGYSRAQVLAAFANGVLLISVVFWICAEALHRFFAPVVIEWRPMLVTAALGLAANVAAFAALHGGDEAHDLNLRGAVLHVVSDLLGSVAAIIAAVAIMAGGPSWIDALLSIVVSLLIGRSAWRLLADAGHILLQGAPRGLNVDRLREDLIAVSDDIVDVHHLQVWQMTPAEAQATMHIRVRDGQAADAALEKIKSRLDAKFGIRGSTVQVETGAECPDVLAETALAEHPQGAATAAHSHDHHGHSHPHAHDHHHAHSHHHGDAHGERPHSAREPHWTERVVLFVQGRKRPLNGSPGQAPSGPLSGPSSSSGGSEAPEREARVAP